MRPFDRAGVLRYSCVLHYSCREKRGKVMATNQRIEDYALISNSATAALVGRNGSIDWLCLPRFDSAACFAALLGEPEHGRWLIAPADPSCRVERRYVNGSLILATMFETAGGMVELVDFIALRHGF